MGTEGKAARWFFRRGFAGDDLQDRIEQMLGKWRKEGQVPDRELAALIATALRPWLRVSRFALLGGIAAVAILLLLLWQNILLQQQINQQAESAALARRAELVAILYEKRDCDAESINDCPPRASTRARTEAALAFIALERASDPNTQPDLSRADLSRADFTNADLSGVMFMETQLEEAFLGRADLREAYLRSANLRAASLGSADLQNAFLMRANLQNAFLGNANLRGANLQEANLRTTDLQGANLQGANLDQAKYNEYTKWPSGFDPEAAGAVLAE